MKTLYLIRHAKSSWTYNVADHDRPLGKRGRKDVIKMGKFLGKEVPAPESIISSTASRAFYTALFLADHWDLDEDDITLSSGLFHAGTQQTLEIIRSVTNCDSLAIFGHNPGFTDMANRLANTNIANIPTCGIVGISFEIDDWKDVEFGKGKQLFFHFPKGI